MADFISSFIEATNAKGGMSLSNSFKVNIRTKAEEDAIDDEIRYGSAPEPWFHFLCDEAQLPNVQAATGTIKGRYLGEGQVNYPHTRVFTEVQLGFQCDADQTPLKYLNNWFGKIFRDIPTASFDNSNTGLEFGNAGIQPQRKTTLTYPDSYCRDIIITKTETGPNGGASRGSLSYVLQKAWPFAIDAVPLQFGTAQLTKVTAQFYYSRHHLIYRDIVLNSNEQQQYEEMIEEAQRFTGRLDLTRPYQGSREGSVFPFQTA